MSTLIKSPSLQVSPASRRGFIRSGSGALSAVAVALLAGKDAMVRWESTFVVPPNGSVTVTMRATDGTGDIQTEEFQLPQPDGASGRAAITVSAG